MRINWNAWSLDMPAQYNATKITGDYRSGSLCFASKNGDLFSMEWRSSNRMRKMQDKRSLTACLGKFGIQKLGVKNVELEIAPWGCFTDGFVFRKKNFLIALAFSRLSRRMVRVVALRKDADKELIGNILSTLNEQDPSMPQEWSVLGCRFIVPSGFKLDTSQINLGNLSFDFSRCKPGWGFKESDRVRVRFIAPAKLALERQALTSWLSETHDSLFPRLSYRIRSRECNGDAHLSLRSSRLQKWFRREAVRQETVGYGVISLDDNSLRLWASNRSLESWKAVIPFQEKYEHTPQIH